MIRGKELAEAVLKHVLAHPERHKQSTWVADPGRPWVDNPVVNECGTQACLAGWTVLLNADVDGRTPAYELHDRVARRIGLPAHWADWEHTALKLLFPDYDPRNWILEVYRADSPVYKVSSAFYVTGSEGEAIERFADAFDLEVPAHE